MTGFAGFFIFRGAQNSHEGLFWSLCDVTGTCICRNNNMVVEYKEFSHCTLDLGQGFSASCFKCLAFLSRIMTLKTERF